MKASANPSIITKSYAQYSNERRHENATRLGFAAESAKGRAPFDPKLCSRLFLHRLSRIKFLVAEIYPPVHGKTCKVNEIHRQNPAYRTRTKFGRDTGNIPQANKRQELPACTSRRTSPVAFERVHRPRQSKTHQHNRFENLCHYLPPFIHGFTQSAFGAIHTMLPCPCQPSSTNRPFGRSTGLAGHLP